MTDAPHLPAEDQADFARVLDDALRDSSVQQALRAPGRHLNSEQLHTKALLDADRINGVVTAEYRHYAALRAALAQPDGDGASTGRLAARLRSEQSPGLFPTLTALTPILAGAAGVLLLLIGYVLRAVEPAATLGRAVVTAGWVALAIAVAALLVGIVGLLLTAVRDGSADPAGQDPNLAADLADARRAWHSALHHRAILPYLYANLDSEPALSPNPAARPVPPQLLRPGYSPARFASPGFTSPGTEGLTDPEGIEPRPTEFTSPGYTSPDFTGPDEV